MKLSKLGGLLGLLTFALASPTSVFANTLSGQYWPDEQPIAVASPVGAETVSDRFKAEAIEDGIEVAMAANAGHYLPDEAPAVAFIESTNMRASLDVSKIDSLTDEEQSLEQGLRGQYWPDAAQRSLN